MNIYNLVIKMWVKSERYYETISIVSAAIAGISSGVVAEIFKNYILEYINEFNQDITTINQLVFLGLIISLILVLSRILIEKNVLISLTSKNITNIIYIVFITTILGFFSGLYLSNDIKSWIVILLIFTISIHLMSILFQSFVKSNRLKYLMSVSGAGMGGIGAGIFVGLLLGFESNFSITEGYILLIIFLLSLIGAIMGIIIIGVINFIDFFVKKRQFNDTSPITSESISRKKIILIIFFFLIFSVSISVGEFYNNANYLSDPTRIYTNNTTIFQCSELRIENDTELNELTNYSENDIINLLKNVTDKDVTTYASLYLLSSDEIWAHKFKDEILEEAKSNKFLDPSGSVKYWQSEIMMRGYYYLEIRNKNPHSFSESENEIIIDWFKRINERMFIVEWVDYMYAFFFIKIPDGLYENQEIGIGALSVLQEIVEEDYPELYIKNRDYINNFGVGWKYNFRNPDDSISYQGLWIKNAYVLAKYSDQNDSLVSSNAKNSFEWILLQWPSNGISPGYNEQKSSAVPDVMSLGASLFNDGEYKWLANKMLKTDETKYYNVGLENWNDSIKPIKPNVGSCYIKGTSGIAQRPGPIEPDKIVFRDGWNADSFYALLNLRFAGWHSYKATNSFITIMYGEPFVVEDIGKNASSWLPSGRALYRDKKIDRIKLNAFQIESSGITNSIYKITGFGSSWYSDPPHYAEVLFFNSTPSIDFSKSRISNWHGWKHDRVSILLKDNYFVVFDNAHGNNKQKIAITWHLKGDLELENESIKLSQNNYSLTVHHPFSNDWYQSEIVESKDSSHSSNQFHKSDFNYYMISEDKSNVGFITLFYPHKNNESYKIENIEVVNSENQSAYPQSMGVKIEKLNNNVIIGTSFDDGEFVYDHIKTDADIFVLEEKIGFWNISFFGSKSFNITSNSEPQNIILNGRDLIKNKEWEYLNKVIVIKIPEKDLNANFIEIRFETTI